MPSITSARVTKSQLIAMRGLYLLGITLSTVQLGITVDAVLSFSNALAIDYHTAAVRAPFSGGLLALVVFIQTTALATFGWSALRPCDPGSAKRNLAVTVARAMIVTAAFFSTHRLVENLQLAGGGAWGLQVMHAAQISLLSLGVGLLADMVRQVRIRREDRKSVV